MTLERLLRRQSGSLEGLSAIAGGNLPAELRIEEVDTAARHVGAGDHAEPAYAMCGGLLRGAWRLLKRA